MIEEKALYFFNDQYHAGHTHQGVYDLKNKLYQRALDAQASVTNTDSIYGTMSDFSINPTINDRYGFPSTTYTHQIDIDIIPYYHKKKFIDRYSYNTPITLIDIINDNTTFSRRLIFTIDKYMFLMLKVVPLKDGMVLAVLNSSANGIGSSSLSTFVANNSVWSLTTEDQSDFYYTYKVKTALFTTGTNNIKMSIISSKLEFEKTDEVNSYNIALSANTLDENLLAQSTAVLGLDTDGVTKCFTVSDAFKAYIMSNSANCKCYIFNNYKKAGFGVISNSELIPGSTGGTPIIQIPYNPNPIPAENINVWTYDATNDILLIRQSRLLTQYYPNVYDFSALPDGSDYYIDWYTSDVKPIAFDNNIGEYIECYSSTYLTAMVTNSAPAALLNYEPVSDFNYGYEDYATKDVDGDVRKYKLIKIRELFNDNPIRYNDFIKKINNVNRKYIRASYDMSQDLNIYNRSVLNNNGQIIDPETRVNFTQPHTYIIFSNSICLNRDILLFIDGKRENPTFVCTENNMTYVYINKTLITATSVVLIEMPLTASFGYNKSTGDINLTSPDTYMDFPEAAKFKTVSSKNLIFYDTETKEYYQTKLFNFGLNVKTAIISSDADDLKGYISYATEASFLETVNAEFYATFDERKIELAEDVTLIEGPSLFMKEIPADKTKISTQNIALTNKAISVTNSNNYRYARIPNIALSNIATILNFKEDPAADRFRVYINGILVDSSHYTYTAPVHYGDSAIFTIDSYTPIPGVNSALVEYLPYPEKTLINSAITTDVRWWVERENNITQEVICSTYGDGKFVSVSQNYAYVSEDGYQWSATRLPAGFVPKDICYGLGKFVLIPQSGNKIYTSIDGAVWIQRALPISAEWLYVGYINNSFMATATDGLMASSVDGITWIQIIPEGVSEVPTGTVSLVSTQWTAIAYGNGIFVAIFYNTDDIMTSVDGLTWTPRPVVANTTWTSVCFGNGLFVVTSDYTKMMSSPDGINWTIVTAPDDDYWYSVAYGNGVFVAVAYNNRALTSPDAITWTLRSLPDYIDRPIVRYGSGLFVATANDTNFVLTSPDGITWTKRTLPVTDFWYDMVYADGKFVIIAYGSQNTVTSPDGINWTQVLAPSSANWVSICYGEGLFVAIAENSTKIMTSPDAVTWTPRVAPSQKYWMYVVYGAGTFIGVYFNSADTMISEDGFTWTPRTIVAGYPPADASAPDIYSMCYGEDMFVAITDNNKIATSPDGVTWTGATLPISVNWASLAYGNGLFMAIAGTNSNVIITSPDGINWTQRAVPVSANWNTISYGNGIFAIISTSGNYALTSADGITWETFTLSAAHVYNDMTFGNGIFMALGSIGNMAMSTGRPILYNNSLFDITLLTKHPFDKNVAKVYLSGLRVSPEKIIETRYNNIIKINGYASNQVVRIDVIDADDDCYSYNQNKSKMLINELLSGDDTFRTYINNHY